jgi:hypothetical protein
VEVEDERETRAETKKLLRGGGDKSDAGIGYAGADGFGSAFEEGLAVELEAGFG